MGLLTQIAAAEPASGTQVATVLAGTAYGMSPFPLSTIVSACTLVLTLFYIWGALPRVFRTAVALYRGVFRKDWSLWQKLGDQPNPPMEE